MIKKIVLLIFLMLILMIAGVIIAKDWILKTAVERLVAKTTGFPTHVDNLQFDLPSTLHIEGLEIRNPAGFKEKIFAHVPEIYVSLELSELLRHERIHLKEVRLNIQEINIERNRQGVSNIELLSSVGDTEEETPAQKVEKSDEEKQGMPFLLDRLELTIRKASFKDYSGLIGTAPIPKGISVDLNMQKEVFGNIHHPGVLVNLILVKVLQGATFGKLFNLSPEKLLGKDFRKILSSGRKILGKQAVVMRRGLDETAVQAEDLVAKVEVTQKVEGALSGTKSILSGKGANVRSKVAGLWAKMQSQEKLDSKGSSI